MGRALLGKRVGDTVHIDIDGRDGYDMVIRSVERGSDDGSVPLNKF